MDESPRGDHAAEMNQAKNFIYGLQPLKSRKAPGKRSRSSARGLGNASGDHIRWDCHLITFLSRQVTLRDGRMT